MWTTAQRAFTIRYFHYLTLLLLVLWSLSPIGGQASLRVLTLETGIVINTAEVSYQTSTNVIMAQTATSSADGMNDEESIIETMYGAAQMQSDSGLQYSNGSSDGFDALLQQLGGAKTVLKSSTQDIWGNIRIPVLQLLPGFDPNNINQWVSVPHQDQIISYESLIGIPFQISYLNGGNASFSLNSTYFRFDCPSIKTVSDEDILNGNAFTGQLQVHNISSMNSTSLRQILFDADGDGGAGFSLDTTLPLQVNSDRENEFFTPSANSSIYPPRDILIISHGLPDFAFITCYAKYHYVESLVTCSSLAGSTFPSCAVDSIRDIRPPNVQETLTPIEEVTTGYNLLEEFSKVCLRLPPLASTTTEYFLVDPPTALGQKYLNPVNLTSVANEVLANRFTLLFNTFWHSTINPSLIVGRPVIYDRYDNSTNPWSNTTASISSSTPPSYVVKKGWLAILIISAVILFFTGLIGIVIKYSTRAPDIFGYVSSLTRDSPYLEVPGMAHEDFLTGSQRARLMKDVGVRFLRIALERDMEKITLALFPPTSGEQMEV